MFLIDTTLSENLRLPAFGQWCTSYFDHADIVGRDLDKLSWVLASSNRTPTFFNGLPKSIQRYGEDAATDLPFLYFSKQILAAYRKAFFDPGVFPGMKRAFVCGDRTCAFGIAGLWAVQDDEKELRTADADAKAVKYRIIPGANHFLRICPSSEIRSLCCIYRRTGMIRKRYWIRSLPWHRQRCETSNV